MARWASRAGRPCHRGLEAEDAGHGRISHRNSTKRARTCHGGWRRRPRQPKMKIKTKQKGDTGDGREAAALAGGSYGRRAGRSNRLPERGIPQRSYCLAIEIAGDMASPTIAPRCTAPRRPARGLRRALAWNQAGHAVWLIVVLGGAPGSSPATSGRRPLPGGPVRRAGSVLLDRRRFNRAERPRSVRRERPGREESR